MSFISPAVYQEALQHPQTAFFDPELQQCTPETNTLGLPRAISGAFAVVFPVMAYSGKRYAVRFFTSPRPDQAVRYRAISRALSQSDLPYFVPFDFQKKGIRVEGDVAPLIKMDWVEGQPLNQFVEEHLYHPQVLQHLGVLWRELLHTLEEAAIAHGDLQHGNVLVVPDEQNKRFPYRLVLVDYDTMYVPALKGKKSLEVGHRNYQHPDRGEQHFGPWLDRFAGLVIYTSIEACRVAPELWETFNTGENMLFQAGDFYHPSESPLLERLYQLDDVRMLADALKQACYQPVDALPSLESILQGKTIPRISLRRVSRRARFLKQIRYGAAGAWLLVIALMVGWSPVGGSLLIGGLLAGWLGYAWWLRRTLPSVQRRKRLLREVRMIEQFMNQLQEQIKEIETEYTRIKKHREAYKEKRLRELQEKAMARRLKRHFVQELESVEGLSHKVVIRLKAAGIRSAYHITPERMQRVTQITSDQRARVMLWRKALESMYQQEIPQALSLAEERQVERMVERHLEELIEEKKRLEERVHIQQQEKERVHRQLERLPEISLKEVLLHILGVRKLARLDDQPIPAPVVQKAPVSTHSNDGEGEDKLWWQSGR